MTKILEYRLIIALRCLKDMLHIQKYITIYQN